jgi:hypothetical protein
LDRSGSIGAGPYRHSVAALADPSKMNRPLPPPGNRPTLKKCRNRSSRYCSWQLQCL